MVAVRHRKAGDKETLYSELHACLDCGISFEALTARHFSFNSPYGACPVCSGLGTHLVFDEDLVMPDKTLSIKDGAIHAWRRGGRRLILHYRRLLRSVAKHYGFDAEKPFNKLPKRVREVILHGSGDEEMEFGLWRGGAYKKRTKPFEGVLPNLMRRYQTTESEYAKQTLQKYMSSQPCRACEGLRLKPESRACLSQFFYTRYPNQIEWQTHDGFLETGMP